MTTENNLRAARVPKSRTSRLLKLGSLAGRVAGNVVAEGSKRWVKGENPPLNELLLTQKNLTQVADKLARMRGAAMKMGQLLSMDAGTLLPAELAAVLARLQAQGMVMPKTQLLDTLERNLGDNWMDRFSYFSFEPVAAASIGQVHRARLDSGEDLAIKIQFPGVAQSIDSDIDNVVSLLRLSGLIPRSLDLSDLINEARRQLHLEADYLAEAEHLRSYAHSLEGFCQADQVVMPQCYSQLTSAEILTMSFVEGQSLESWLSQHPEDADRLLAQLLELFFTELLQFNLMQTDPNPANFQVQVETGKLVLLDFGAVRRFDPEFVGRYKQAIDMARSQSREGLQQALEVLGFFAKGADVANREVVLDIFMLAAEPLRAEGAYDFGHSDLARRIQQRGMSVSRDPNAWHTPPADVLFLHRKMAGMYLLAAKYGAKVDVNSIYRRYG
ncbi:MAG TPA: AarF/ABC1/UbiB kinase family protein [Marinobacterium sp.]|nr:AarF/ABC1/UbiB kinase family protein [Marinobacterium sp.]